MEEPAVRDIYTELEPARETAALHTAGEPALAAAQPHPQQQAAAIDQSYQQLHALRDALWDATVAEAGPSAVQQALSLEACKQLLQRAAALLKSEPTLLELAPQDGVEMLVVGDTHGHFHDVCHLLNTFGYPGEHRLYVFNGDYVDRGSWGFELLVLLLSLKLAHPTRCYLLRGNHESTTCTTWYGFKAELSAKWGKDASSVYALCKKVFSLLPLAALVQGKTLIMHGGLFRAVVSPDGNGHGSGGPAGSGGGKGKRSGKRKRGSPSSMAPVPLPGDPVLGTLSMLRAASKGGLDPDGLGQSVVAADVLWSDPGMEPGLRINDARGVGLVFGPDATQAFLEANGLRLILRSHEGPDARDRRTDLPQVLSGWSLDHDTPAGKLYTVFSAPDYPQFMAEGEPRYRNQGSVAVLTGPTWHEPDMRTFDAVQPRPPACCYYDIEAFPDTDEEPAGSTLSAGVLLVEDDVPPVLVSGLLEEAAQQLPLLLPPKAASGTVQEVDQVLAQAPHLAAVHAAVPAASQGPGGDVPGEEQGKGQGGLQGSGEAVVAVASGPADGQTSGVDSAVPAQVAWREDGDGSGPGAAARAAAAGTNGVVEVASGAVEQWQDGGEGAVQPSGAGGGQQWQE